MSFDVQRGFELCKQRLESLTADRSLPETVRDHTVSFYPWHWEKRWPAGFARPDILAESGKTKISRSDLLALGSNLADNLDDDKALLEFYVKVCGWGSGSKAQNAARTAKPFQANPDEFVDKLRSGLAELNSNGAVKAYWHFNNYPTHIKYLGPAFFTKLLYFADPKREALILDSRVARSLGSKTKTGWTTKQYEQYLVAIEEIRKQLDPTLSADCIEYLLFQQ